MKYLILSLTFLSLLAVSCSSSPNDEEKPSAADSLFQLSCKAITQYTDSLRLASDSAKLQSASTGLEERLKKINEQFPLKTDTQLTEGQQDTLIQLTEKYLKTLSNRLNPPTAPDTTTN